MCGIAGIVDRSGQAPARDRLRAMIGSLAHRGPDGNGIRIDGGCGLAHARLAIVDLAGGAQPMTIARNPRRIVDPDDTLSITFNGEIFNYVELRAELWSLGRTFTSTSDTEVILQAYAVWGDACVTRMNGDFAFAIWDPKHRRLFCARDRVGVRPFFHAQRGDEFVFASEVRALFAAGVEPAFDARGLAEVATLWSARAPRTVWRGVSELPAGCTLVVDAEGVHVRRYWQLDYGTIDEPADEDDDEVADELRALLDDATRIRLRADVPVGSYLSGGLDSSVVTALAAERVPSLSTFSVTFASPEFDERQFQNEVAGALHTSHHAVDFHDGDVAARFADVVVHAETPLLRTAPAPLLSLASLVRASGMKVVLTGEGADEMLGGYDIFKEAKIRRFCARQPSSTLRPRLLRRLYPWMPSLRSTPDAFLRGFFDGNDDDAGDVLFSHMPRWRLSRTLTSLFSDDVKRALAVDAFDPIEALRADLPAAMASWDPFAQAQYLEATTFLPGYLLSSQGDRMAMAHGVEARFPFLDVRVIERAARMSPRQKMRALDEKHVLKRAATGLIPESVRRRKKQPYRAPDAAAFLTDDARALVDDALAPDRVRAAGVFDATATTRLVDRLRRTKTASARDGMALAFLLSTQICFAHFIEERP